MRDFQRQRIYDWEADYIDKIFPNTMEFPQIKPYVDKVWSGLGLMFPPAVKPLPRNSRRIAGDGCRMQLRFLDTYETFETTVLHEIAHALTMNSDNEVPNDSAHGAIFAGMFIELMVKFMNADRFMLWASANAHNIKFTRFQHPLIIDDNRKYG